MYPKSVRHFLIGSLAAASLSCAVTLWAALVENVGELSQSLVGRSAYQVAELRSSTECILGCAISLVWLAKFVTST
jgi:hypothetical protein